MYEALLKATPEYQKIAASFAKPGPAALFGLPPAGRALLYAALQKDLGRVLCIVTPGEAEATHFADDLKALVGELERPMILSNTETKDDKDGRYTTFTFKRSSVDLPLKYAEDPTGAVVPESLNAVQTQSASGKSAVK